MRAWWTACWLGALVVLAGRGAPAQSSPPVIDLHVDLPYQLLVHGRRLEDARAATSPERLRRGNVEAVVLPLFVVDAWRLPPSQVRAAYQASYQTLLRSLKGSYLLPPSRPGDGSARGARTWLAFEGADGFANDPGALIPWIARGACLMGPVHTRTNALAGSSSDPKTAARRMGLTPRGEALVRTAYAHGALVDIAHASDPAVRAIAKIAKIFGAPLVCSHTAMRSLKPIERNISDEQLRWIASSDGVVGVDLHSGHIGSRAGMLATLDDYIRHLEHAVRVAGIDHVAIGSDLDGGIAAPRDADGAATWPLVAARLRQRGWPERDIAAVFHDNAERVLKWASDHGCGFFEPRASASPG